MSTNSTVKRPHGIKAHRMPDNSLFYDKFLPILFLGLGIVMVVLVLFAAGVLAGVISWK